MKKKNNEGFSLVELIIVIAIMAILIVVLAPQFIKFVEKGRESTDLQNITEAKTTVETYVADKGIKSSAKFTVTLDKSEGGVLTVECDSVTDDDLKKAFEKYGVDPTEVAPTESEEWSDNIVWTYTEYMWKLGDGSAVPHAAYLDANGDDVDED